MKTVFFWTLPARLTDVVCTFASAANVWKNCAKTKAWKKNYGPLGEDLFLQLEKVIEEQN